MKNMNATEIMESLEAFTRDSYHKSDILPELLKLQKEVVILSGTGTEEEAETMRIKDVENHLDELNALRGCVATDSVIRFKRDCKDLNNAIRAEISGLCGENKAVASLNRVRTPHTILRNIELTGEYCRTEIDAAVITPKGIFIIEVKNTAKNVFIDEEGNFYRTGEYLRLDCQIGEKMANKEVLLREALNKAGITGVSIFEILVFTNNRIEVQNKYSSIKSCFLAQLPYIIDNCTVQHQLSDEEIAEITEAIESSRCYETYKYQDKLNIPQFKEDFVEVMTSLSKTEKVSIWSKFSQFFCGNKQASKASLAATLVIR